MRDSVKEFFDWKTQIKWSKSNTLRKNKTNVARNETIAMIQINLLKRSFIWKSTLN